MRSKYDITIPDGYDEDEGHPKRVLASIRGKNAKRRAYRVCEIMSKAGIEGVSVVIYRRPTARDKWCEAGSTAYDPINNFFIEDLWEPSDDAMGHVLPPGHMNIRSKA